MCVHVFVHMQVYVCMHPRVCAQAIVLGSRRKTLRCSEHAVYTERPQRGSVPEEEVREPGEAQGSDSPSLCCNCKHGKGERERIIGINLFFSFERERTSM